MELYRDIIYANLKHHFLPQLAAAIALLFLTAIVFNITGLNEREAAKPMELLVCFVGTIFLTPIFLPEQDKGIYDVVCAKKIDYWSVCVGIRLLYSAAAVIVFVLLFGIGLWICESEVSVRLLFGGIATALFLGAVGFTAAGLSQNVIVGYMVVIIYYLVNYGLKEKLGNFYLFSMCMGSFSEKWWLFGGSIVLAAGTILAGKLHRTS